jgi:penicillin-binding protein 1A
MARKDPKPRKTGRAPPPADEESWDDSPPPAPENKRRTVRKAVFVIAAIWILFAGGIVFTHWLEGEFPDTNNLFAYEPGKDITLVDVKGRLIARRGLTMGEQVRVDELPAYVGNAFIAVEDRRFRYHFGVDPFGLLRAAIADYREGAFVQGGSTLTQQLAKNLFLKPDRTLKRKIDEAVLALYLESKFTKDEILTLYLNRVYFGAGVYGIEAASERFFGKRARNLTITEAAILAGSVKAPSRYNPEASPDAALARARLVLDAMETNGFIDADTWRTAAATRPKIAHSFATPGSGYFIDYAMSLVPSFVGETKERMVVETTLDLDLQNAAEQAVAAGLAKEGPGLAVSQAALVGMTPDGAVRALVGGRSYDDSTFNRATEAMRQPGSAFKPFVYLAALEHGHSPSDQVVDGPVTIGNWTPDNYESNYAGTITLAQALARSSNSASVQLTNEVGPRAVVRVAKRLGIVSTLHAVPSLALGTSEVTPLELTAGYAAFANGGTGVLPFAILRIKTVSGKVLYRRRGSGMGRVVGPAQEAQMTTMMSETVTSGTGRQAALEGRAIAGKTGTSQGYRDAWFVGFSADYVCAVWAGNDGGAPMNKATGGGLPARIFKAFMAKAEERLPPRPLLGAAAPVPVPVAENAPPPTTETARAGSNVDVAEREKDSDSDVLSAFENLLDRLF